MSGILSITGSGPNPLSVNGSYSHTVTIAAGHFVVETQISYSHNTQKTTTTGGATNTIHQTGSYSFVFSASGNFSANGSIADAVYNLSESTSMTSEYWYSNAYTVAAGTVTAVGFATANTTGTSESIRTESGTFSATSAATTITGQYEIKAKGSGSGSTSDAAEYKSHDPRSAGQGTVTFASTFANKYIYSETSKLNSTGPGSSKIDGTVTFDSTEFNTGHLIAGGKYTYDHDGARAAGSYALDSKSHLSIAGFKYVGTMSAAPTGFSTSGNYELEGNTGYTISQSEKGTYAVNRADATSKGDYDTGLKAVGHVQFWEDMNYEATPMTMLVNGGFHIRETASVELTNSSKGEYAGTAGNESYSGKLATTHKSTDTVLQADNSGDWWSDGTTSVASGKFDLLSLSTSAVTSDHSGGRSRPNHSLEFSVSQTRDDTRFSKQSSTYHIDAKTNTAQGKFEEHLSGVTTSHSDRTTNDVEVLFGSTHHTYTTASTEAVASTSSQELGEFKGHLSDTAWKGTYENGSKLDTQTNYTSINTHNGNGRSGSVTVIGSGTGGFTRQSDGEFTRSNRSKSVDGQFDHSDYQTAQSSTNSSGNYSDSTTTGSYTSYEFMDSTFDSEDSGMLTVRDASTTTAGNFSQTRVTIRDTDSTDDWSYVVSAYGRTDSGVTKTSSDTSHRGKNTDTGHYNLVNGVMTGSGVVTDSQDSKAKTTRWNANSSNTVWAGVVASGKSSLNEVTQIHRTEDSDVSYSRGSAGVSLTGNGSHSLWLEIDRTSTGAGTETRARNGHSVILTTSSGDTYHTAKTASGTLTFRQSGSLSAITGPVVPGLGRPTLGAREESGSQTSHEHTQTTSTSSAEQNTPTWEADGTSLTTGSIWATSDTQAEATYSESASYTIGAAGESWSGSFSRAADSQSKVVTGSTATGVNPYRSRRGQFHTSTDSWVARESESQETNGQFTRSLPAQGTPSSTRSASVELTSTMTSRDESRESAHFTTEVGDTAWMEAGLKTVVRDATEVVIDSSQYSEGSNGSQRSGTYSRTKSGSRSTTGTWVSAAWAVSSEWDAFGMKWGNSFGLFQEYLLGDVLPDAIALPYGMPTGKRHDSAMRSESWDNAGESSYQESGSYSSQSGEVGVLRAMPVPGPGPGRGPGVPGDPPKSPPGPPSLPPAPPSGPPSVPPPPPSGPAMVKSGSYTHSESSRESWQATDQSGSVLWGNGLSGNRHYHGEGFAYAHKWSSDSGSFQELNGVATSSGVKSIHRWSEDRQGVSRATPGHTATRLRVRGGQRERGRSRAFCQDRTGARRSRPSRRRTAKRGTARGRGGRVGRVGRSCPRSWSGRRVLFTRS